MSIANSRMTFASILGAVQTSANTITNTLQAANQGVGMLNKLVSDASHRQEVRSKLDNAIFAKTLHQEKAQELTESRLQVLQYCKQSTEHQTQYQSAFDELSAVMSAD